MALVIPVACVWGKGRDVYGLTCLCLPLSTRELELEVDGGPSL